MTGPAAELPTRQGYERDIGVFLSPARFLDSGAKGSYVSTVAMIRHSGKTFGGGTGELRDLLDAQGVTEPPWYEVAKSKQAPDCARDALEKGTSLGFVWGGDGTVGTCVDALAGSHVDLAILLAGTANLLATNLGIPKDLPAAVLIGQHEERRSLDTGTLNGEHFAVMAGAGLDALMIRDAVGGMRPATDKLVITARPGSVRLCIPSGNPPSTDRPVSTSKESAS